MATQVELRNESKSESEMPEKRRRTQASEEEYDPLVDTNGATVEVRNDYEPTNVNSMAPPENPMARSETPKQQREMKK